MSDDLPARVRSILAEVCAIDPARVQDPARLASFGVDSVRAVDVLVAIEHQLGVELPDQEAAALLTVGDLVAAVARHREG